MGATQLNVLKVLLLLTFTEIITADHDVTFSVFTVTSKSMTVQWSGPSGASSYKITMTPKNSSKDPVFAHFSSYFVMGSVNSLSPNTLYTVQLEALDNDFNVLSTASTEETTAPEVPSIIQAYSKHSDSITVEFTESPGATSYILRAEAEDFFLEVPVSSSPGTILPLQPFTNYMMSVMSVNSGGRSQPSYPVETKTVVVAPQLNITSPDNNTLVVTWPEVENAVLYTLCIIQEGSTSRLDVNTTDTMWSFDNLEAGTTYCIKGTAYDAEGRPGDDVTYCKITRPQSPYVSYIQLTQGRSIGLSVYWQPVQGAESYIAYTSDGQNCSSTPENYFCYILSVECGQNHTITVTAYNSAGPSSPSAPAEYITYPCPPENIMVEEPEAGSCMLEWDDVLLVDYYMAFIKRDDGVELSCNTTETNCSFFCKCGHTFLTSVFPYNEAGSSPLSPIHNYTTIPCCPQDVAIKLVSTETLEIMWSAVSGAELYETTAEETRDVIHCNDTAPVCALSDLRCNTVYSVTVTPCSELRGCNHTCRPHAHETAPCSPEIVNMTQTDPSTYSVRITNPNTPNTNYTVTATGHNTHTCQTTNTTCDLTQLPCGSVYDVTAVATTAVGQSLPGYSEPLETGPCCPTFVNVTQVTQAMTNVTWSPGGGARSYITSLTSLHGHAKCHTQENHCLMGCITCSTNYSITLEAISSTGHKSECTYQGFSSSPCCPTGIKLYRSANNSLRVHWRSLGPRIHSHTVEMYGTGANYTCIAPPATTHCDIQESVCGNIYTVVVAPTEHSGVTINFCQSRTFSVPCPGSNFGFSRGWQIGE
ncbi:fibronectin type III domain-containing protein 7 [Solea solea]|uniref:fibronectin type III domain-containing protein 7 n=1 Tax=Solea solea TaxID=90069 RepID=UPI002729829D|nr:fibronectin type III domain-containing protein 7 [Solea solea]